MPTLTRLLTLLLIAAAVIYGVVYALATFVTPQQRDLSVPVPERGISNPAEAK